MTRHRTLAATTLLAVALTTTACGDSTSAGGEGAVGETLTIGVSTPQTGPLAINHEAAEGLQAYFDHRSEQGDIAGHNVKVELVDNQGTVQGGTTSTRSILSSDPFAVTVLTTAGFTGAQSVLKTSPDVPALVLANGAAIQAADLPNAFGLFTDYTTESFAGMDNLTAEGSSKFALVYDPTIGERAVAEAPEYAKSIGGEIVASISVPATTTNYTPVVQKIKAAGADGIVFQVGPQGLTGTMKAARQSGVDIPAVAHSGMLDASVLELGGEALEDVYFTALFPLVTDTSPEVQEFASEIEKRSPDAATVLGLVGWNAGALIEAALDDAAQEGELTRDSFMDALRGLGGKQVGVLQQVGWTPDDVHSIDAGNPEVFRIYQVQNGAFEAVE